MSLNNRRKSPPYLSDPPRPKGSPSSPSACLGLSSILVLCWLGSALACLASAGPGLAAQNEWGQQVISIRLDSDADLNLRDFTTEVTQKVGEPLDRSKVTESLKRLYATGRFLDLRADVEPKGGGVELIFVARAAYFSGLVRVEGTPKSLDPKLLTDASRLRLGQALSEDDLVEATLRLLAVLADNAYYEARVHHRLIRHPDTQEVDVLFSVVPGPAARLSRAEFEGQTVVPPATLAEVTGWRSGRHLTSASLERGLSRIHKFYVARGRLAASTNVQKRAYDPGSCTETLQVKVEAGPLVRVRVAGASLSEDRLRELLSVYRDGVVDEEALSRGEKILEDYFQRQGYVHASVKASRVDDSERQRIEITFRASLGTQEEFAGYGFQGNHSFPEAELAAAIAEGPSGSSSMVRVFSQELLARHVDTLRAFYQARGFLEARVTPRLREQTEYQLPRLFVTFEIEEGIRTKVRSLLLRGVDREVEKKIWPSLLTKPGEPYSPERAQADRDSILSYLANQGYTHASAGWEASPISPAHETDLVYQINRGPQERIKQVVVMGQRHTREGVIRRQLAFREGEPLRQGDLAESQKRLYDLGIFNQVQITKQDTQSLESEQTLLVDLEEARRWTVGYGGGIEVQQLGSNQPQGQLKASPRLSLEVTRLNVGGRAQTFSIHGQLSNLESGGGLGYLIPHLLNRPDWTLRLNGLVDRSHDVLTFTADRREGSVSIEKRLSPTALVLGRYAFRRVQALDISNRITPEQIPLYSRPARVGAMGTSFVSDRRDDPADATEGSYSVADAGVAWTGFGSEANFLRFSGQNSTFRPLSSHFIFARSTRFGVESPFGYVNLALAPPIPLPERFFMGGSESHRGFAINQAGPRDPLTGYPLGGNASFFNSFELRAPFEEKRLGLVLFHDAGNVFSTIRKMRLLKFTQNSPTDLDYDVQALGVGVRYKTPVAPVRFDMGYDLNPPRFQAQVQPNPSLAPILEVRRLSRFQFFLSIGQSF